jgi:arsenate reductase
MAYGYLNHFLDNRSFKIYSEIIENQVFNPEALAIKKEDGISIDRHTSNNVNEYSNIDFDYIITVCNHANENCP